ncbi:GTPase [Planktothrix agardhii]|jgi:GTP-binding protein EngB required for normal cell division|uniref:GTPase n=1 Tax=Planktothrix agardhii TaxID=1160 RepID=UPI0020A75703|nr:GTPase [Planktothrix agardhii]CAD5958016.1 Protein containing N-terminal predicted GTPase domain [Planktothrix rubescens]CAD5972454.1 Protein containing N-terminal predicted GTPase domain [Planktothrix agardhii]
MTDQNSTFKSGLVGEKFNKILAYFDKSLAEANLPELTEIQKKLREELKVYREDGVLSVAFIGQYSSGKSTIISALTGNRDIKIDADIATDRTTAYNWNGIKIIDTPGLFTERQDHDQITYEAINKADLLVFCLTYMLFDSITVENFKNLAYNKGYRWKMMLVVNKMSDGAGEEEELIAHYRESLAQALKPYSLDEFPVCFIDAKDYCEGIDEKEDFLIEISRFQTFINALNKFVQKRSAFVKFDTPIRITLGFVDEAELILTRNSPEDNAFLEILTRLSRVLRKERSRLQTQVKNIALKMSSQIVKEGTVLANAVGTDEDFALLNQQSELNVKKHYETAEAELQNVINAAVEDVRQEFETLFHDNLVQSFVACLDKNQTVSANNVSAGIDMERLKSQVTWINAIGETAGVQVRKMATNNLLNTGGQGFLRSIDVAGSSLHQAVLEVGKFVGFKFQPWQAVGIAKDIGNVASFLGPILAVVSVGVDLVEMQKENQRQQQMADIRQNITSQFQVIAKDLENQILLREDDFEQQVYGEIDKKIAQARQDQQEAMAASNTWFQQLIKIRNNLGKILDYVSRMSNNSEA